MFTDMKNALHSTLVNTYSKFVNVEGLSSKFLDDGTLTPEEVGFKIITKKTQKTKIRFIYKPKIVCSCRRIINI